MANSVVQIIFDQFLDIVERLSKKSCFIFDYCRFEFRVREAVQHKLLDVIYIGEDRCCRRRDVIITIDITNICTEDLITCKWVNYLEKLAKEFIADICPKRLIVVKEDLKKCRPQPPVWKPFPCKKITTVIHKIKPIHKEPECEVVYEKQCECVKKCKREPCVPKHEIIIKYQTEKPWKCGDASFLVEDKHKDWKNHKGDAEYADFKGNKDYNDHVWPKCCGGDKHDDKNDFYKNTTLHH